MPLGLDSQTLGKLAVPLISIGGSVLAGKVISDYLEGRGVLGIHAFPAIHTDALPGAGLLLASPLRAIPVKALPLPLAHGHAKLGAVKLH